MYGGEKAEALGQESHTFLQIQFPQAWAEIESELLEQGYWQGELIHTRRDGSTITVACRWVMQKDEMGRPVKILEINNDISLHKQAQAALQWISLNSTAIEDEAGNCVMSRSILFDISVAIANMLNKCWSFKL